MTDDQTTADDECGICLETLTAAVTLPCTHRFCANCLDGWKSKFGSLLKEEKRKSCPLCREKIPPSKDMFIQLELFRKRKRKLEARGDTTSQDYMIHLANVKRLEAEIGDYDGDGLDYDGYMEMPKFIFDAVKNNNMKRVIKWLGSPVDKKRLNARDLVQLASLYNSDLLSILLQYGADVNALNAMGCNTLFVVATECSGEKIKILLEWGAEIALPRDVLHTLKKRIGSDITTRNAFAQYLIIKFGNNKFANLVSSEFGGRRCEVINLPNHPQFSGKTCVVEKYITKKDKYKIIFEGSGNAALVGPNNLKRRDRTPLDCGYYITFENGKMSRREFATKEECEAYVTSLDSSSGDVKETAKELESLKLCDSISYTKYT